MKRKEQGALKQCYWIWYPGDFELYYAMKQNFSRVERGYGWPAFWKSEGFRNRVVFRRTYVLEEKTSFCVTSRATGFCMVTEKDQERKYPFGRLVTCGPGEIAVSIHAGCIEAFPSIYIEGDIICSDPGWIVEDYASDPVSAGYCKYFTESRQNPAFWDYSEKTYQPVRITDMEEGVLYEFETELTAALQVTFRDGRCRLLTIFCGESREEALDLKHCYYSWQLDTETGKNPCSALRFAFIPDCSAG